MNTELVNRIEDRSAKVCFVGQGYVGLPAAMRASQIGYETVGYDVDAPRIEALQQGRSYVEDIDDSVLAEALERGFVATDQLGEIAGFDVAVITVPTPLRDGAPDLSYVRSAAEQLAKVLRAGSLVVLESTTYPGTTEEFLIPILEQSGLRAGADFAVGYSPERIDPGNTTWRFDNTPKVVAGYTEQCTSLVAAFYASLVDKVVPVGTLAEAELVKVLENTFRHVNIALVNELAMFARQLDVDVWQAIDAAATKPFGFMPFRPGPGVGGHCLPIDPSYLSWRVKQHLGHAFRFVELANDVNEHMPDHVMTRVTSMLNDAERSVKGSKILLLGLTYKANTSDWRESPSLRVAELLADLGADLIGCDPHLTPESVDKLGFPTAEFSPETLEACDLAIVLVDHPEFKATTIAEHAPLVFDTKGILRETEFSGQLL